MVRIGFDDEFEIFILRLRGEGEGAILILPPLAQQGEGSGLPGGEVISLWPGEDIVIRVVGHSVTCLERDAVVHESASFPKRTCGRGRSSPGASPPGQNPPGPIVRDVTKLCAMRDYHSPAALPEGPVVQPDHGQSLPITTQGAMSRE